MAPPSTLTHILTHTHATYRFGQLCVDCQLGVFDLRTLRPLPPTTVTMLQPLLLRCMPAWPSTILVLSRMGEFQFLDLHGLVTPSTMMVHQLSTAAEGRVACCVDISPSCQGLAFGDSCGERLEACRWERVQ